MKAYPRGFLPLMWCVMATLFASGLLLVPGMLELKLGWDVALPLPEGSRLWFAAVHALVAFAALVCVGALLPLHVRHGWRLRQNVRSGLAVLTVFAVLALTGLAIYYIAEERVSLWSSALHACIGIVAALAITIHVIAARRLQAQRTAAQRDLAAKRSSAAAIEKAALKAAAQSRKRA